MNGRRISGDGLDRRRRNAVEKFRVDDGLVGLEDRVALLDESERITREHAHGAELDRSAPRRLIDISGELGASGRNAKEPCGLAVGSVDFVDGFDRHTREPAFVIERGDIDQRASPGKQASWKLASNPKLPKGKVTQHATHQQQAQEQA